MIGAQPLPHALQREGQCQLFNLGIDGHSRVQLLLDTGQGAVGVFAQARGVGFGSLVSAAHQQPCIAEQNAVEPGAPFDEGMRKVQFALAQRRRLDQAPGIGAGNPRVLAQELFILALARHQGVVVQRVEQLAANLEAVLEAVEGRLDQLFVGRGAVTELNVAAA